MPRTHDKFGPPHATVLVTSNRVHTVLLVTHDKCHTGA